MENLKYAVVRGFLVLIAFSIVVLIIIYSMSNIGFFNDFDFNKGVLLFIIFIIGLIAVLVVIETLINDIKQLIIKNKTKKYGISTYGIIKSSKIIGYSSYKQKKYKTLIDVINPSTNQLEHIEDVGLFNYYKFPYETFILCKYYEGDILFEDKIESSDVPNNFKRLLKPTSKNK